MIEQSTLYIFSSIFSNLQAMSASAIFISDYYYSSIVQSLTIVDSQFINNKVATSGGSIISSNVDVIIRNSTFTDNKALQDNGGAIYLSCSMQNTKSKFILV